ncbi:hypothetical protein [Paenibacillus sp. S28]|uniref:hypothetical protein n=1 Tax=Paenibacillus sp. S28 TaxID=2767463 RepID=UPI002D807690|nr:hypothetical protein [Paenibacillus sp. S28]
MECLKRKLREEMQIAIEPYAYFRTNDHCYGEKHIRLIAYKAVVSAAFIKLADHDEASWVKQDELDEYTFAPADVSFVNRLMDKEELSSPRSDADNTGASDIKTILAQSYDNHADHRNSSELEGWKAEEYEQVRARPEYDDRRFVRRDGSFMQAIEAARTGDGFLRFGFWFSWHHSSLFLPFHFISPFPKKISRLLATLSY